MTRPAVALTAPVGPDDAALLVLGPSLGTTGILWEKVLPALTGRYRVVTWDLPGHGRSAPASAPFTVADLADAVVDAAREVSAGPFWYAGVSLGGAVGLELLLRHPDAVRAAAIIASGAQLGDPAGWHERAAKVRAESTSSIIIPSAQRWFAPDSVAREPELSGRLLHALQNTDDDSYARCCEALADYDVRDRLDAITTPVLAVWGEHDAVAPEAKAREIADGVPGGRIARIADAAHLPPAEQPEDVARVLVEFFDSKGTR
ncbi:MULTISPECIES: alpha/beta hydrolase [unclassified Microbacterium]|uniref:alpha/beta hydrolase n=1 Tax=unclassified Microbacterium TaxID=2609290 RepID=UPI00214CBBAB|nr:MULTISPECIES: alpha/beta hydrolase [unclassified Microbacterium]MCR2783305.1 alpha/beta hydrolase [Microbacterium sp. zg.B96]MDL5351911.1 alpha/beta hydrolase [Microbacterium sp. zg-YB36]WIM15820.1 alpha/beta hydrolase [Microbacterium sp. zg-B96]